MGSYKEVEGNLLDMFDRQEFDVICQGCNCFSTMGAGIAAQIKERYPTAFSIDSLSSLRSWEKFGQFTWTYFSTFEQILVNLYTQYHPGPNADLCAIRMSLKKLVLSDLLRKNDKIGLPLIGCGIGGLDWNDVRPIIQEELKDFYVTVVHFKEK